jgi:regulator of cell morphogenesis and NO signaling
VRASLAHDSNPRAVGAADRGMTSVMGAAPTVRHARSMHIDTSRTVSDLAAGIPGATRIFEARRIDTCCSGDRSLAEACAAAGVRTEDLLAELESAAGHAADGDEPICWEDESLADLAKHLVERHHTYTRDALERLGGLSSKVLAAHGEVHPELKTVRELFEAMDEDLLPHMTREEVVLFPYIEDLETSRRAGRARPFAPFGSVDFPIRAMMHDHDHVGGILRELRSVTRGYAPPADACGSWKALYAELEALDRDLIEHMRLEAEVLFPRTMQLERT